MRTIGFVNSHKENEKRVALVPEDLRKLGPLAGQLVFERGYGKNLEIEDEEYESLGARMASREEILRGCEVICDPKIGDSEYLGELPEGTVLFGWVHPHVDLKMKELLLKKRFKVYAWEEMMENGTQVFWRNNVMAGEAAVADGCMRFGILLDGKKAAILGRGNTAMGAFKVLSRNGAEVTVYGRRQEAQFKKEMGAYDVIVNAVLWDPKRQDHIISREDLHGLKRGVLLIDVSCDAHGAIETSHPTKASAPIFMEEGVAHYCLDHTPSLYYRTASQVVSGLVAGFIEPLVTGERNEVLESGLVIDNGVMCLAESCR